MFMLSGIAQVSWRTVIEDKKNKNKNYIFSQAGRQVRTRCMEKRKKHERRCDQGFIYKTHCLTEPIKNLA